MKYSDLVKKAANISFAAHKNDVDKGGYPYFMHPMALAFQFEDEATVCVALLHDVVEDHGDFYTFEYLIRLGFSEEIINALKLLTHKEGVNYLKYIKEIKKNPIARKVKLADLKHNSDLSRNNGIKPPKYDLYQLAIEILESKTDEMDDAENKDSVFEDIDEEEIVINSKELSSPLFKTYHAIACAMRNNPLKTDDRRKALAKETKKFLLYVLNERNKGKRLYDAVIASQAFHFFNHQLAWNKSRWKNSSEIVYNYFKAKIIIETIKSYEPIAGKNIVVDYKSLIDYLASEISIGNGVNYGAAPGLTSDFDFVPIELLEEKLHKFKEYYE